MLSPHNYDNICILQNLVFSVYYNVFLFNICMSIHPMTKVTGILDISHKIIPTNCFINNPRIIDVRYEDIATTKLINFIFIFLRKKI